MVAPHARVVATALDASFGPRFAGKTVCTGIPLKPQFLQPSDENTLNNLRSGLNLDSTLPIVLAVGGSLGAERLNNWLISQADDLLDKCQLILVAGRSNYASSQAAIAALQPALVTRLHLLEFSDRIADLMRISDIVITRAGATTLMEIAAIGRPALIVPNDMLSGGHQSANAQWFVSAGMAESLTEAAIASDPALLVRSIYSMLGDEPRRRRLAQAVAKAHRPDSSEVLAGLILKAGRGD
jgi:UDP-N-acetylglucosamine--N-acetylmuramyl-(pentapeptide) pyrophosphoryl-undecaprenol N-acetylglucosamine transferase